MADFAPVCPIHIACELDSWYALRDYHLLLAHDILNKPDEYRGLFNLAERINFSKHYNTNYFSTKILDNSVIELGTSVDIDVIAEAARVVAATVIVLPDVLLDSKATVEACKAALDDWTPKLQKVLGNSGWSFMVVPQGLSRDEWTWCAEQFEYDAHIGWWGIPRNYSIKGLGSRREAVDIASAINTNRHIHLLGFGDDIIDDVLSVKHPKVTGIDSAVPLRIADAGMKMSMIPDDLGPRGDWWDRVTIERAKEMADACNQFRKWIRI